MQEVHDAERALREACIHLATPKLPTRAKQAAERDALAACMRAGRAWRAELRGRPKVGTLRDAEAGLEDARREHEARLLSFEDAPTPRKKVRRTGNEPDSTQE